MRGFSFDPGDRRLAKNTLWMITGQGLRVAIQAAYFVLIARALGAHEYGALVGVVALVAIVAPFASWGSGNLMIKHVARDESVFSEYWGRALAMTALSGAGLAVIVVLAARSVLPGSIPFRVTLLIAIAELLFSRGLDIAGQAFQAFENLKRTAQIQVLPYLGRFLGAVVLLMLGSHHSAAEWALVYAIASGLSAVIGFFAVRRELGKALLSWPAKDWEYREGFLFAISLSSQSIYNDIDKTMLAKMSTLSAAGIYAAAYRVIDVAVQPIRSLLYAAYAGFFQHGALGVRKATAYARRLLPSALAYGLVCAGALFVAAPILPKVLGQQYAETAGALRWLALIPLMKAFSYFPGDVLTGADRQVVRSVLQVAIAGFNVLINLWLIPLYSWRGAAWASLASDGLLGVALWLTVIRLGLRDKQLIQPADLVDEKATEQSITALLNESEIV